MEILNFSRIGKEDIRFGTGTFEVKLSDGRSLVLSELNISAFLEDVATDTYVMFADGSGSSVVIGQDANFTYDKSTDQLTLAGTGGLRIGSSGTAEELLHVGANGAVAIRLENTGVGTNDVSILMAINGSVDWNITLDDSASDNLLISEGSTVSTTPHLALHRSSTAVTIGTDTKSADNTNGLVIAQGSADDDVITFKSSDIAHGVTAQAETDTYGRFRKLNGTAGGLLMTGISESTGGMFLAAIQTGEDTSTTGSTVANVVVNSSLKTGTTTTTNGTTANLFGVYTASVAKLLVKGDGDVYNAGGSTAMVTFDDHDDIQLIEAVKTVLAPNFRDSLGDWVESRLDVLRDAGVVHGQPGDWFISQRGLSGLLIDAIRQLAGRVVELEGKLSV